MIPAAGLGSRLGPLTRSCPKELLELGGQPALRGVVLELEAAGVEHAVVVTSPRKPRIAEWLGAHAPWIGVVLQPEPRGVFDAVERGRAALSAERLVVLFPDSIHLPDQTGLATLLRFAAGLPPEASAYPLQRRGPQHAHRLGPTASVVAVEQGSVTRIESVGPVRSSGLHTALAELRGTEHTARAAGGDEGIGALLQGLARDGLLFGVELPGDVLDVGVPGGYADAVERFADGRARWRPAPIPRRPTPTTGTAP